MVLEQSPAAASENEAQTAQTLESHNIIFASLEKLWNWGRSWSFWPLSYGCNCCPIEMMAAGAARFDIARYGYEVFRASPRQADLLIVAGPVTVKMAPVIHRLYEQMPSPKWVVAMGNCAISGGPFRDGYSILPGADSIVPVDIFVPGCPVRPEALFHGLLELKKKVSPPLRLRPEAWRQRVPEITADDAAAGAAGSVENGMLAAVRPAGASPAATKPAVAKPAAAASGEDTGAPTAKPPAAPAAASTSPSAGGRRQDFSAAGADRLRALLPDSAGIQEEPPFVTVRCQPGELPFILGLLKEHKICNYLANLTAVDYPEGMELVYHLFSLPGGNKICVKARLESNSAPVPSVTGIFPAADWQERELFDLMGISFSGHPRLERILLPEGFTGHPLRKDYRKEAPI